jgi:predicted transposase YbfD/YdcC
MLLRVDHDVIAEDGTVRLSDTRYFVSSLDPDKVSAADLLAHVRSHWEIENSQFFVKDRWWDEDRHWTRRPGVSRWLATLTSCALSVLRAFASPAVPLRATADDIAWDPAEGLAMLGLG